MSAPIATNDFMHLLYEVRDHVATITINRPDRRNALNRRAYDEIEWGFRAAASDPDVRCVIVTAVDPAFCSGEDDRCAEGCQRHPSDQCAPRTDAGGRCRA